MTIVDLEVASTKSLVKVDPIGARLLSALQFLNAEISPREREILLDGGNFYPDAEFKTTVDYTHYRISELAVFTSDVSMKFVEQLLPECRERTT